MLLYKVLVWPYLEYSVQFRKPELEKVQKRASKSSYKVCAWKTIIKDHALDL